MVERKVLCFVFLREPKCFQETFVGIRAGEYVDVAIHCRVSEKKSETDRFKLFDNTA